MDGERLAGIRIREDRYPLPVGLAGLREPTQMLVIRTVDGVKLIPVFVQTTAQLLDRR